MSTDPTKDEDEDDDDDDFLDEQLHDEVDEQPAASLVVDRLSDVGDWELYRCVDEETACVAASFGLRRRAADNERLAAIWLGERLADEPELIQSAEPRGPWNNAARTRLLNKLVDHCRASEANWPQTHDIEFSFLNEVETTEED